MKTGHVIPKAELDSLYSHVCPKCLGRHPVADSIPDFGLPQDQQDLIRAFYDNHPNEAIHPATAKKTATILANATAKGYGKDFFAVAWESPDWDQIRHLQTNVYQFAFAKNHEQMKALTQALYDDAGKIVPYEEFKTIATRINQEHSTRYLRTEYNTAIAGGQMSSRWVQYQSEKDTFPNLEYQTVGDDRVRESHRQLDGIVRPVEDSFWDTYYPPNGWYCRCDVVQAMGKKVTVEKKIPHVEVPKMFRANLSEQGLVYPEDHPYFKHVPDEVLDAANGNNPFLYKKIYTGEGGKGGFVYDSALHKHGEAWKEELITAKILANGGDSVVFLPEMENDTAAQKSLRKIALPQGMKEGKNPDAIINGRIVEMKHSESNTPAAIDALLRAGKSQADIVCIRLSNKMPEKELKKAIQNRVIRSQNIEEVWVIKAGKEKAEKYSRSAIEEWK